MTVKELIRELQNVPEDAIVLADHHLHGLYEVVEGIEYNDPQNVVYFWGNEIYDPEESGIPSSCNGDCMECHEPCQMNQDISNDVDETNDDLCAGYISNKAW